MGTFLFITMTGKFQCEILKLNQVYKYCRNLAIKIQDSGFKPDIIVAIARGGYVPSRLLCDFLSIHKLTSIKVEHYVGTERGESAILKYPLNADIKNKNVLLVDDVNDTGKSIRVAHEHLKVFGPAEVKTAVMHEKKGSLITTDYYVEYLESWRWLIYEWAIIEDVGGFIVKSRCKSEAEALDMLKTEYGIIWKKEDLDVIRPFIQISWP